MKKLNMIILIIFFMVTGITAQARMDGYITNQIRSIILIVYIFIWMIVPVVQKKFFASSKTK